MIPPHLEQAIHQYLPTMEGWLTPERGVEMAGHIYDLRPEVVVELGVFGGRSLIAQAMALRELNHGVIYGIDPWKTEAALEGENAENRKWWSQDVPLDEIHRKAMNAVWQHQLDQWAVIIRASSQHVAQLFPLIDMLFIDANHSEIASTRDVDLYATRVRSGGIITIDDTDWPTTANAVAMLDGWADLIKDGGNYRVYRMR